MGRRIGNDAARSRATDPAWRATWLPREGYNTPRDMQDRMRREPSTSKSAKMDPAWELNFQRPFKGRWPGGATHPIPRAPRRPGQTYQVDLSGNFKPARVNEPCGVPNKRTDDNDKGKHQQLNPFWPPRTRQLSELEANETPGQPTPRQWKGSIRPQRVATASAQGPCRELASEAARGVCVRGRSVGKPVDDYRRERIRIGQPAPSALQDTTRLRQAGRSPVALQPKPAVGEGYCVDREKRIG